MTDDVRELLPIEVSPSIREADRLINALIDHCVAHNLAYAIGVGEVRSDDGAVNFTGATGTPWLENQAVILNVLGGIAIKAKEQGHISAEPHA